MTSQIFNLNLQQLLLNSFGKFVTTYMYVCILCKGGHKYLPNWYMSSLLQLLLSADHQHNTLSNVEIGYSDFLKFPCCCCCFNQLLAQPSMAGGRPVCNWACGCNFVNYRKIYFYRRGAKFNVINGCLYACMRLFAIRLLQEE